MERESQHSNFQTLNIPQKAEEIVSLCKEPGRMQKGLLKSSAVTIFSAWTLMTGYATFGFGDRAFGRVEHAASAVANGRGYEAIAHTGMALLEGAGSIFSGAAAKVSVSELIASIKRA